jgi:hypothetical protein
MSKKICTNSYIFIILASFLHLGVPPNSFLKLVCRELKKVENHCSSGYSKIKALNERKKLVKKVRKVLKKVNRGNGNRELESKLLQNNIF